MMYCITVQWDRYVSESQMGYSIVIKLWYFTTVQQNRCGNLWQFNDKVLELYHSTAKLVWYFMAV